MDSYFAYTGAIMVVSGRDGTERVGQAMYNMR